VIFFLFAPWGIGRNIDIFGVMNFYNISENEVEAGARVFVADAALKNDFDSVLPNLNVNRNKRNRQTGRSLE
jgi:hypothetical protein